MKLPAITRDKLLIGFALALGTFEVVVGEARPSVLTFVSGVLLSPLVMRADAERERHAETERST